MRMLCMSSGANRVTHARPAALPEHGPHLAAGLPGSLLLQALHAALPALGRLLPLHHVGVPPELIQLHSSRGARLQVLLFLGSPAGCCCGRCTHYNPSVRRHVHVHTVEVYKAHYLGRQASHRVFIDISQAVQR